MSSLVLGFRDGHDGLFMYGLRIVLVCLYVILKWTKVCFVMGTKFLCVVTNALFVLVFLLLPSCFFDVLMVGNATSFGPKFVCMVIFSKICVVFGFVFKILLVFL